MTSHRIELSIVAVELLASLESLERQRDLLLTRLMPILDDPMVNSYYSVFAEQYSRLSQEVDQIRNIFDEDDERVSRIRSEIADGQRKLNELLEALEGRLANSGAYSMVLDYEGSLLVKRQQLRDEFRPVSVEEMKAVNLFDTRMAVLRVVIDREAPGLQNLEEVPEIFLKKFAELHTLWEKVETSRSASTGSSPLIV